MINHFHIADLQHAECDDISADKLIILGNALKEIFEAKLAYQFPEKPCEVDFFIPEDTDNLYEYQLSFWQKKHQTDFEKTQQEKENNKKK